MSADSLVAKPSTASASSSPTEDEPTTPQDGAAPNTVASASASDSQQSLPSTEAPASPADPAESFKTERNEDRPVSAAASLVIPSSLTPPPSSQVPTNNGASRAAASAQRLRMLSPPVTGLHSVRPDATPAGLFTAPRPEQVVAASPDELRVMLQNCLAEQSRLKMEAAHHKLQYQLLSVRADEDAHRAAVEQELILCQLDALQRQKSEPAAPTRRIPSSEPESNRRKYDELKDQTDKILKDYARLRNEYEEANRKLKGAKRLISKQEVEAIDLRDEIGLLRNRLLDKRDLWEKLASPGGMFHTPIVTAHASPAQNRQTPRQTPKHRGDRQAQPFDVLLQAATQENSSVPGTPVTPNRALGGRQSLKHHRSVQSLSSLPSTPNNIRPRGSDLLPPPDLVPHTEPSRRFVNRNFVPDMPDRAQLSFTRSAGGDRDRGRQSRETTVSADDNETLARAALQSVAQAARSINASRDSPAPRARMPLPSHRSRDDDSQIYESQASQEASAMLRRDPRESFEVASSHNSRDVTPTPVSAEKRMQSTLRGPVNKLGVTNKRKLDAPEYREEARREPISPTKRLRLEGGLRDGNPGLGLGIRD